MEFLEWTNHLAGPKLRLQGQLKWIMERDHGTILESLHDNQLFSQKLAVLKRSSFI